MKAVFRSRYGTPEVLTVKEIGIPVPKDNEMLVRVYASTVNRSDYHLLTGKPYIMRAFTGLFKPKLSTTGTDFAGQIVATGKDVTAFTNGDKVMGFSGGLFGFESHAQYLLLTETKAIKTVVNIPSGLTYEQAAACLEGAIYAAGAGRLDPKPGQNALVYGATGAIGTAYIQFLQYYGLSVTAVCREEHAALVRSLGATKVIDYIKHDFTKDEERYDFIFDAVGRSSFLRCKSLLKKDGRFMSSGGAENILLLVITPLLGGKKVVFKSAKNIREGLLFIKKLVEEGSFRPVIDKTYPLDKIAAAFTYVATGQKIGNVILTIED